MVLIFSSLAREEAILAHVKVEAFQASVSEACKYESFFMTGNFFGLKMRLPYLGWGTVCKCYTLLDVWPLLKPLDGEAPAAIPSTAALASSSSENAKLR